MPPPTPCLAYTCSNQQHILLTLLWWLVGCSRANINPHSKVSHIPTDWGSEHIDTNQKLEFEVICFVLCAQMFIFLGLRIILETSAVVVWKDMMAHLCVYKEPLAAGPSSFLIHPNPAHLYHNVTYPSISLASAKSDKTTGYSHQQTWNHLPHCQAFWNCQPDPL